MFVDKLLGVAFNGIWIASMDAKAADAKGSEVRMIPSKRRDALSQRPSCQMKRYVTDRQLRS